MYLTFTKNKTLKNNRGQGKTKKIKFWHLINYMAKYFCLL